MTIIRGPRPEKRFYILNKSVSEDQRLTWEARGMLVFLLGKPDDWQLIVRALVLETAQTAMPAGRDVVRRIIRELIDAGYIVPTPMQCERGRFGGTNYDIYEVPRTGSPDAVQPDAADPPLTSTDVTDGLTIHQGLKDSNKPPLQKKPKHEPYRGKDRTVAEQIFAQLLLVDPDRQQPSWNRWCRAIRLMREQDRHTHAEILELFGWANADSYWQPIIVSPQKLRKLWATLSIKRNRPLRIGRSQTAVFHDRQCNWNTPRGKCKRAGVHSDPTRPELGSYCDEHWERLD